MSHVVRRMKRADSRQRLIRLIHVAKRELAMADDAYRDMLRSLELPDSAANMSVPQLEKAVEHMKQSGFKVRSKGEAPQKQTPMALAHDPETRKIRVLWLVLHELGAVKDPSEAALAAYVKRMTQVDALQWTNDEQAQRVIEALKQWAMRFLPQAVKALEQEVRALPLTDADRERLHPALHRAFTRGTFEPMHAAWELLVELKEREGG